MLDENTFFSLEKTGKSNNSNFCYFFNEPFGKKQIINNNRTTIYFASLIAQKLEHYAKNNKSNTVSKNNGKSKNKGNFGYESYRALESAYNWVKENTDAWYSEEPEYEGVYKTALNSLTIINDETKARFQKKNVKLCKYKDSWEEWEYSSKGLGIINPFPKEGEFEKFQLWRGEGTLPKYLCAGGPKRDQINSLVSSISTYQKKKESRHSHNCLLISAPGWGKSFLASCIANYFDFAYLPFSIAQMSTTNDLIDCLATIASMQNRTDKKTLVFIDEINADIQGHSIMGLLLDPLWTGLFMYNGKTFKLKPGVWIFASTVEEKKLKGKDDKGSDFISRLNGPIVKLDPDKISIKRYEDLIDNSNNGTKKFKGVRTPQTEYIYILVYLLNDKWGPINKIQKDVLKMFFHLEPSNGFRSLEFFADIFEGIEGGKVVASNVPKSEYLRDFKRHVKIVDPSWYKEKNRPEDANCENEFVRIELAIE